MTSEERELIVFPILAAMFFFHGSIFGGAAMLVLMRFAEYRHNTKKETK